MAFPTNAAPQSVNVRRNQFGLVDDGTREGGERVGEVVLVSSVVAKVLDEALPAVVVDDDDDDDDDDDANAGMSLRSLTGVIWGMTTRLFGEAPGSTPNCVVTIPLFGSTPTVFPPATRRKSNSTKTADGCVSCTNCPAKVADCWEICAVPNKYTKRLSRCQTLTLASHVVGEGDTTTAADAEEEPRIVAVRAADAPKNPLRLLLDHSVCSFRFGITSPM